MARFEPGERYPVDEGALDPAAALGEDGFFVREGFLGPGLARDVARAALARVRAGELRPAAVRRGARRALDPAARGDSIAWVTGSGAPWEEVRARFDVLGATLNREAFLGLKRHELQLAYYPGGGAGYVRHRDAFPEGADNRRVTAILYLNDGWQPRHGGCLRIYRSGAPLEVAPVLDRLVVFLSEQVEHEVLPVHAPRLALTAWYYAHELAVPFT